MWSVLRVKSEMQNTLQENTYIFMELNFFVFEIYKLVYIEPV